MAQQKTIFITGTDTGVGKTVLTALLVSSLRQAGVRALAIKPFCSGSYDDVDLIGDAQEGELTREEIAPYYFAKPLAPLAAVSNKNQLPSLRQVLRWIRAVQAKCDVLVVEGSGGLMVPVGNNFMILDLIAEMKSEVVLVGRNQLGTINHTLLSVRALRSIGVNKNLKIVLMEQARKDLSARNNLSVLRGLVAPLPVYSLGFLGKSPALKTHLKKNRKKVSKTLASLIGHA